MSYAFLKRNVFNLDLKRLTSEQAQISKGSFILLPATTKVPRYFQLWA